MSWPVRIGAAAIWFVMVWDLYERVRDNAAASSIVTSIGLVAFVTLTIVLPYAFNKPRPREHTPARWGWDAMVITAALFALAGLLVRAFGK